MKKELLILFYIFMLIIRTSAQTVSNVTVEQVDKTIRVSYDLDKQAEISLHLSIDGGKTYTELHKLSGDVGKNVAEGHKTIVWDVLAEREKLVEENVVFLVRAKPVLSLPIVLTISVTDITSYSATATGDISSNGGSEITSTGFCWSKKAKPTIYDNHTKGSAKWFFSSTLSNLSPKSKYYVRAYATNSVGIAYGEQVVFKTNQETKSKTSYTSTKNVAQHNPSKNKNKQYNPRPFIKGTRFQTYLCSGFDFISKIHEYHFQAYDGTNINMISLSMGARIKDYTYVGIISCANYDLGSSWPLSIQLDIRGYYPINKNIQPFIQVAPGVELLRYQFKNPAYAMHLGAGFDIYRFTVCLGYYFVCGCSKAPVDIDHKKIERSSLFLKFGVKIGKIL